MALDLTASGPPVLTVSWAATAVEAAAEPARMAQVFPTLQRALDEQGLKFIGTCTGNMVAKQANPLVCDCPEGLIQNRSSGVITCVAPPGGPVRIPCLRLWMKCTHTPALMSMSPDPACSTGTACFHPICLLPGTYTRHAAHVP